MPSWLHRPVSVAPALRPWLRFCSSVPSPRPHFPGCSALRFFCHFSTAAASLLVLNSFLLVGSASATLHPQYCLHSFNSAALPPPVFVALPQQLHCPLPRLIPLRADSGAAAMSLFAPQPPLPVTPSLGGLPHLREGAHPQHIVIVGLPKQQ